MLDYPEGTLGTSVPATENTRVGVLGQLRSHEHLQRILPPRGLIRVFFVWDFASHAKGQIKTGNEKPNDPGRPVMVQPKGVTINSHWLMVLGAKASLRERSPSTAHEIGHALLGSDPSVHRDDDRGNLMWRHGRRRGQAGRRATRLLHQERGSGRRRDKHRRHGGVPVQKVAGLTVRSRRRPDSGGLRARTASYPALGKCRRARARTGCPSRPSASATRRTASPPPGDQHRLVLG
jgi:hypothetical protein